MEGLSKFFTSENLERDNRHQSSGGQIVEEKAKLKSTGFHDFPSEKRVLLSCLLLVSYTIAKTTTGGRRDPALRLRVCVGILAADHLVE